MFFNSINFAIFLPIVYALYWLLSKKGLGIQNVLLLVSSYFFYACWDWRFLFLLVFSTLLDYITGIKIETSKNQKHKIFWFWLSISVNLGFLGVFKYYNFFANSFADFSSQFGFHVSPFTLKLILPVGISFYTFHGLSYIIDIYKNRIEAEKNFIEYSVFVSFFPLLVAGPIERATHLLPQIKTSRAFNYEKTVDGLRQILWGLFKKVLIADLCAENVNIIFNNYNDYSGSTLVLGAILFAFQIYGDFSGYSDIALGTARLFGIELLKNFSFPYFSRDIAEFWRRWHISLSSWFRDYIYIPLGGSKGGTWSKIRNTLIIFLISGFWHGANWTFIIWGLLNALFIIPSIIFNTNRNNLGIVAQGKNFPTLRELLSITITFSLTTFAWIFFRADNLKIAIEYIARIGRSSVLKSPYFPGIGLIIPTLILLFFFLIVEWIGRENKYAIEKIGFKWPRTYRLSFYSFLCLAIWLFQGNEQEFIYFQF